MDRLVKSYDLTKMEFRQDNTNRCAYKQSLDHAIMTSAGQPQPGNPGRTSRGPLALPWQVKLGAILAIIVAVPSIGGAIAFFGAGSNALAIHVVIIGELASLLIVLLLWWSEGAGHPATS